MRRFIFLMIIGIAGVSVLVALGIWQVQRLSWKQGAMSEIAARIAAKPGDLPTRPDPELDKYRPVSVTGTIAPGELHVLVSLKRLGPGYRVISPFETADGQRVLIDRGFVTVPNKDNSRQIGPFELTGNLHWPQETDRFTPEPDIAGNTWFARDVSAMAQALKTQPILIVAKSPTGPGPVPMPVDTVGIPNDHLQYAITWFSLALIWASMTAYFLWRTGASARG